MRRWRQQPPLQSVLLGFEDCILAPALWLSPSPTHNLQPLSCSVVAALQLRIWLLVSPETASSVLLTARVLLRGVGGVSCRQNPTEFHLLPTSRRIRPHTGCKADALDLPGPGPYVTPRDLDIDSIAASQVRPQVTDARLLSWIQAAGNEGLNQELHHSRHQHLCPGLTAFTSFVLETLPGLCRSRVDLPIPPHLGNLRHQFPSAQQPIHPSPRFAYQAFENPIHPRR